jgi:sugar phosphate isomerase/epimerase/nucleoside-diphosphate-sugar epimerase
MNCIIGYTGFVGSNISCHLNFNHYYNSKNIHDIVNFQYDTIYCAGVSAKKWYANLHPDEDINNINNLLNYLRKTKTKKIVLISTIDVYTNTSSEENEDNLCINESNHVYGKNRLYFENEIKKIFEDYHIIRLPGLFGFGLRKNIIFDFIFNNNLSINEESNFQWYHLDYLHNDIEYIIKNNIKEINLFTEPLNNKELIEIFRKFKNVDYTKTSNIVNYNLTTKYSPFKYWQNKKTVVSSLINYLNSMLCNKLAISNLSFSNELSDDVIEQIKKDYGIKYNELAPNKTFGDNFIDKEMDYFKSFNAYSFQAILYPHPWSIFDDRELTINYIKKLIDIGNTIGIKIIVFGSPKNRVIDEKNYMEYEKKAISFFKEIGDYAWKYNICVCIEPNARVYGCNYITNSNEGVELVKNVNSNGFGLHLDTGCMYLENENILEQLIKNISYVKHIHFSVPKLKALCDFNEINFSFLYNELIKCKYDGLISIEMINQDELSIRKSLHKILGLHKIKIIGAGWYGCHNAKKYIENGSIVELYEANSEIFQGSSRKNQNRLHLGFHYMRSHNTRKLCISHFNDFMNEYGLCTHKINNNLYIVSKDSLVDYNTCISIFKSENIPFMETNKDYDITHHEGIFVTDERVIDNEIAKRYFEEILFKEIKLNSCIKTMDDKNNYTYIINATFGHENFKLIDYNKYNIYYEVTLSLIYECKNCDTSYTIIDGDFMSLYPYDYNNNLYTLTHVKYTPLYISNDIEKIRNYKVDEIELNTIKNKIEEEFLIYYKQFKKHFTYKSYFTSIKTKYLNTKGARDLIQFKQDNIITFICGKITGIFDC